MTTRLITIPPSHFCDKARWALDRAGLPYQEEPHPPPLHAPAVKRAGGRRSTPTLVTADGVFDDSTDILGWIQRHPDAAWRPYPDDADDVVALEDQFDEVLGPHVRRLAYGYLMPRGDLFVEVLTDGVPRWEGRVFRVLWRLVRAMMRRSMRIDDAGVARSAEKVEAVLADVDARLADGRRWLVGDRFTAADLTFAALSSILFAPEGTAAARILDRMPGEWLARVEGYRARPSGRFVHRLYAEERATTRARTSGSR